MSLLLQRQGCSLHVTFELSGWDCDGKIKRLVSGLAFGLAFGMVGVK